MNANRASIMPQVIATWCEQAGHRVRFLCYTGVEDLEEEIAGDTDLLFIGAFTRSAQLAYAVSNLFRKRGVVTAIGGPHARSFPEDASRYFDYVLGLSDKEQVLAVAEDCARHRPRGVHLSASRQPLQLPTVRERWRYIEPTLAKARALKIVPMIASMGCPYTCDFCIDAEIDYQPLEMEPMQEDLRFLRTQMRRPFVGWHDPNFGVRFGETMDAIEAAVPPGSIRFAAESSLSLLSEPNLRRLSANGCVAILPGIESWYSHGNKSKTGRSSGMEKVRQVSDHVNLILKHIPYVQTNFVLGLDCDEGPEPFELTKKFIDLAPGAFPAFSLLTYYGEGSPLSLRQAEEGRVLPFPFHFLNSSKAMNVRPKNYTWPEFYSHLRDLSAYSLSWPRVFRRFGANRGLSARWLNAVRARSSKKPAYYGRIQHLLENEPPFRAYFEGTSRVLPELYVGQMRRDLGPFFDALPPGALEYEPPRGRAVSGGPSLLVKGPAQGSAAEQ